MLTMTAEEFAAAMQNPAIRLEDIILGEYAERMSRIQQDEFEAEMDRIINGVPGGSKPEGILKA